MEKSAQKLARNPLGIIALFIVLVYAIAGLVFGISGSNLSESERYPLILFLVLFPVLVLGVFAWLVKDHHTKLYAPGDFSTEEGFFRARGLEEQLESIDEKVAELKTESQSGIVVGNSTIGPSVGGYVERNVRKEIFLAESLVFRDLESRFHSTINRQTVLGNYGFDGFFSKKGTGTAVEIKFTKSERWVDVAKIAIRKAVNFKNSANSENFELVLAIVSMGLDKSQFNAAVAEVASFLDKSDVPVHFKPYSYEALVEKYGL